LGVFAVRMVFFSLPKEVIVCIRKYFLVFSTGGKVENRLENGGKPFSQKVFPLAFIQSHD